MILNEPSDTEETPVITGTPKIHKFTRCSQQPEKSKSIFSSLRKETNLTVHKNTPPKRTCWHGDHDFDSLMQFRTTCTNCMKKHGC